MPNSASYSRREGAPHVVWFYSWQDHPLSDSLADAHRKKMLVGKGAGGLREREREFPLLWTSQDPGLQERVLCLTSLCVLLRSPRVPEL